MAHEITIPKLGLTMTEGTLNEWLKPSGSEVSAGEPLFTLVTDKIEAEIEAEADGRLHPTTDSGSTVPCGTVVGLLLADGEEAPSATRGPESVPVVPTPVEDVDASPPATADPPGNETVSDDGRRLSSPNARRIAAELGLDMSSIEGTGPAGAILAADVERVHADQAGRDSAPTKDDGIEVASKGAKSSKALWTPVARRLATRLGIESGDIAGSGPGGKITLEDVVSATDTMNVGGDAAVDPSLPPPLEARRIPITGMRKVIAERMHASLRDTAQLTVGSDAEVDRLLALRAELKATWRPSGIPVPSVTDFVVKAVALALHYHPRVNAAIVGDAIELLADVHVGVAVDVDDGLLVPTIRHADMLPLDDLAAETSRLGRAARDGRLTLDEMAGATFTVSNLGTLGIDFFTPILNPPNVAILGVGRTREVGASADGRPRRQVTLSLTIDHRALDGAPAARFLGTVREMLEAPHRLLAAR